MNTFTAEQHSPHQINQVDRGHLSHCGTCTVLRTQLTAPNPKSTTARRHLPHTPCTEHWKLNVRQLPAVVQQMLVVPLWATHRRTHTRV